MEREEVDIPYIKVNPDGEEGYEDTSYEGYFRNQLYGKITPSQEKLTTEEIQKYIDQIKKDKEEKERLEKELELLKENQKKLEVIQPIESDLIDKKFFKYQDPVLRNRVVELRNSGKNWKDITNSIREEFKNDITFITVKKLYNRQIAQSITIDTSADKSFKKYVSGLTDRFDEIIKITNWQIEAAKKYRKIILDSDSLDDRQKAYEFIKLIPHLSKLTESMLSHIKFIKEDIDKIKITQEGAIFSEMQLNQKLGDFLEARKQEGWVIIPPGEMMKGE